LLCISLALFQTLQGIFLSIKTHHHVVEHQQFSITLGVVGIVRVIRTIAADDHCTTCDSSIARMGICLAIRVSTSDIVDVRTGRRRASGSWGILRDIGGCSRV
jgi:hypothetical protein